MTQPGDDSGEEGEHSGSLVSPFSLPHSLYLLLQMYIPPRKTYILLYLCMLEAETQQNTVGPV
jgi:hypothetical protein